VKMSKEDMLEGVGRVLKAERQRTDNQMAMLKNEMVKAIEAATQNMDQRAVVKGVFGTILSQNIAAMRSVVDGVQLDQPRKLSEARLPKIVQRALAGEDGAR